MTLKDWLQAKAARSKSKTNIPKKSNSFKDLRPKYGNKKVELDGRSFASQAEAALYVEIKNREKAGEIEFLQCQDHIYLTDARILYIADFKVKDLKTGEIVWMEMKGLEMPSWRIKRRLWKSYGPGTLLVYKMSADRPFLYETLQPKQEHLKTEDEDTDCG